MTTTEVVTQTGNPLPKIKTPKEAPLWLVAFTILLPTSFAMLATSATNVAIPYIAGYFGSTVDEANWVITIYMIANAILIPLKKDILPMVILSKPHWRGIHPCDAPSCTSWPP